MKTVNRGMLKKLAAKGMLEKVESRDYVDGYGETGSAKAMPVWLRGTDGIDRKDGYYNLADFAFKSTSGCAYENADGTITLIIHSNSSVTLRKKK